LGLPRYQHAFPSANQQIERAEARFSDRKIGKRHIVRAGQRTGEVVEDPWREGRKENGDEVSRMET
jgi:hypothetical protein